MQTEIALSTTEAELIALTQAMKELISFYTLLSELRIVITYLELR